MRIGISNAAIDPHIMPQIPPQGPPAATGPVSPAPVQPAQPQEPNPVQTGTAPPAQAAKAGNPSTEPEESELDALVQKDIVERIKTVKIAENTYIRVYIKKAQNPSPQPRTQTAATPPQTQPGPQASVPNGNGAQQQ